MTKHTIAIAALLTAVASMPFAQESNWGKDKREAVATECKPHFDFEDIVLPLGPHAISVLGDDFADTGRLPLPEDKRDDAEAYGCAAFAAGAVLGIFNVSSGVMKTLGLALGRPLSDLPPSMRSEIGYTDRLQTSIVRRCSPHFDVVPYISAVTADYGVTPTRTFLSSIDGLDGGDGIAASLDEGGRRRSRRLCDHRGGLRHRQHGEDSRILPSRLRRVQRNRRTRLRMDLPTYRTVRAPAASPNRTSSPPSLFLRSTHSEKIIFSISNSRFRDFNAMRCKKSWLVGLLFSGKKVTIYIPMQQLSNCSSFWMRFA